MNTRQQWFGFTLLLAASLFSICCDQSKGNDSEKNNSFPRADVREDGNRIIFSPDHPGLSTISTSHVKKGWAAISVIAPGRIVASIAVDEADHERIVFFESADVTTLYSQYRQSKSNVARTTKNLERVKEMFSTQTATGKDLSEAENDANTAKASMSEYESRLRGAGFNPHVLDAAPVNTVWLLSDVPENELNEVQQGEDVDIYFSAFPEKKFIGHVIAIGEVVDAATRSIKVRVELSNPKGKFLPGMFAKIDYGDPIPSVYTLPTSAIVTVDGKDYVFIQSNPGIFERRSVTIVNSSTDHVVVSRGLNDGDDVVIKGALLLKGLSFGF
jgi:cobalt-zinc-cadmium efflux system membrane fusion protein